MVKKELHFIYITSDGSKFLYEAEAKFWQDHLDRIDTQILQDYEHHTDEVEISAEDLDDMEKQEKIWRQTKAKQRAIDLKKKS
tara:strand:+ start:192 stop:440 length:249 start_codon:yes stop_codon:yes gene_type:complete